MLVQMPSECVIGVDLGGTKLLAGAVDADLRVHHRAMRPAQAPAQGAVLARVEEVVREAMDAVEAEVAAVGLGIPCLIDLRTGVAVSSPNLGVLAGAPVRDLMAERLGVPVYVDNDANAALLAEARAGAARGVSDAVLLTVGTGVGGALLLDGRLYRGSQGAAGELGHMVIEADGPRCQGACPNHGCLEAMASGTALAREARAAATAEPDSALGLAAAAGREVTGALVTDLAHDGDAVSIAVLELIGTRLGVGIASLVNIFNPEVVIVGGGVMAAGELLLEPARREMALRALPPSRDRVKVVATRFGAESGMLGAAVLALDGLAGA